MRLSRCQKVLGIAVSGTEVVQVFERLGFEFQVDQDVFRVTPPSFRFDLSIEEDLIEEVARMVGFDSIATNPPVAPAQMHVQPEGKRGAHALREIMVSRDYQEIISYSFVERSWETERLGREHPIELVNPIASQMSVMRSSLLPSLMASITYNANRRQSRVRVFEIGRVFMRDETMKDGDLTVAGVSQPTKIAGAAWGPAMPEQWGTPLREVDFFDVKKDVQTLFGSLAGQARFEAASSPLFHPGRCAQIRCAGVVCGIIGELHPKWVREEGLTSAPVLFELDLAALSEVGLPQTRTLSKQPVVQRDMALWVSSDIPVQHLFDSIHQTVANQPALSIVRDVQLFDVWQPPAKEEQTTLTPEISLAFRFWLQDPHVTLEDDQVERCMDMVREALEQAHGVRQR
jgi:phenylalanyl-tRNA synthetase beta chain